MNATDVLDAAAAAIVRAAEQVPGESPAAQAAWVSVFTILGGITTACAFAVIVWKVARPHVDKYVRSLIAPVQSAADDIQRQVTVNGGKNNPPTLLDKVGEAVKLADQAVRLGQANAGHVEAMRSEVRDVRDEVSGVRSDLEEHEAASGRYLGQVTLVLAEQGIQLPMPQHHDDDERPDERPDL